MSNPEWDITPGSTWKPLTDLKKTDIVRMYDALAQSKTKTDREAQMRRMIHYPPEYETVYATLIARVNRIFEAAKDNDCLHKTKCHKYKEFKHVLNEFQGGLFTDSGKPVRFTTRTRSPSRGTKVPRTPPRGDMHQGTARRPPKTGRTPQRHGDPAPVQPSSANNILNMPDWKINRFGEMILERNTDEERTNFIKKYVHVTDADGEPFPGLLSDIIVDILHIISNWDETTESKIKNIFVHLLYLKTYPEVIRILYPFPVMYPSARRNPSVRRGGGKRGGKRRRRTKKARAN
ncbi:MAG: hypothetical protein EBU84_06095 [Actinobacteria bacterium]|nr:hypothetical protein [Actinomycetota bacterium]